MNGDPSSDPSRGVDGGLGVDTASDLADLDHTPEQMAAMGRAVLDMVVAHQKEVMHAPCRGGVQADDVCRAIRQPLPPEQGREIEEVLRPLFDDWVKRSFTTPGPGYMAFVPGGGLFSSVLASLVGEGTNRFTGIFAAAPALVQLEGDVLDWLAGWMQYPAEARGLLTTGGSMANFSAIVVARETLLGQQLRDGVLYTSTQVHHCVTKSARMAGILADRVRMVPVDAHYRMRMDALAEAIAADRAAGLKPFLVVSSAGTTNTGAVDPLPAINTLCHEQGLWHHCDGAYGAMFHMVPELRGVLDGLSQTDSLTLDPHKGMFLPYGTGALLVRDGARLKAAHGASAGYLPDAADEEFYDPAQYGPELSRDYRGLKVWLPLQVLGAARFRAAVHEKYLLAQECAEAVSRIPGVVMDTWPELSLFSFHLTRPRAGAGAEAPAAEPADLAEENRLTRALMEGVIRRGRVMLSGCEVDGRFLGRVCILCFRSRRAQMEACVEDLASAAAELLAGA
ncbi:MAG: decarboxylase [Planctomycetota bacterium]|nr:MAG: decarboxylase [Planctomycetota bacterium]